MRPKNPLQNTTCTSRFSAPVIILDLDLKSLVVIQKRKKPPFNGNACVSEKIIPISVIPKLLAQNKKVLFPFL